MPRVTVWHQEACQVMSDCDPEGRVFLSVPYTHDRFFFLQTFHFWKRVFDNAVTLIADVLPYCDDNTVKFSDIMCTFDDVNLNDGVPWHLYSQCISNMWIFSIFTFPTGLIWVCEIRFASTGVICRNLYPVCKKMYLPACAPNKDSNQSVHPRSLVRGRTQKKLCILGYPKWAQLS